MLLSFRAPPPLAWLAWKFSRNSNELQASQAEGGGGGGARQESNIIFADWAPLAYTHELLLGVIYILKVVEVSYLEQPTHVLSFHVKASYGTALLSLLPPLSGWVWISLPHPFIHPRGPLKFIAAMKGSGGEQSGDR